jgi:arsenite-transporting ATPase
MAPAKFNLHCVSADLPSVACALIDADQQLSGPCAVLDLSGEQWLDPAAETGSLRVYAAVPYAMNLWKELQPRLDAWLQLLQLQQLEPLLVPPLPGVDMLLRCLALSEALDEAFNQGRSLTVLLPAPGEALALLELARTGPALLESLLEPLLAWWDQTRQSLASLELVLRLKLPSSESLRLNQRWRQRLERMAELLAPQAPWQLTLVLECSDPEARLLRQRFCSISLRGFLPSRVGLHGMAAAAVVDHPPSWWLQDLKAMVVSASPDASTLERFLKQLPSEARSHVDPEGQRWLVPMPGVEKGQLDVQQIGTEMVLICAGQRCVISLPSSLQGQQCSGARLEQGWLELRFG